MKWSLVVLLLFLWPASELLAQQVTIDTRSEPYRSLPAVAGMSLGYSETERIGALSSVRGEYNARNPYGRIAVGDSFKVIWSDGSSEEGIASSDGSMGSVPKPGTQRDPNGNPVGSGGGGGGFDLGGTGGGWVGGGCFTIGGGSGQACAEVGGNRVCETVDLPEQIVCF